MLLYQMSQWLDERQRLQRELRRNEPGAASALESQIQELDERLYGQARQWLESESYQTSAPAAVPGSAYEPPVLSDPQPSLH